MTRDSGAHEESSGASDAPVLTEGQARHLRVCFTSLLAETRELLEWTERSGSSPEAWIEPARIELERLAGAIEQAAADLSLPLRQRTVDSRHHVAGWASTWWAGVLDCRPEALKAYGPVHPAIAESMGPRIEEMAKVLLHIVALARGDEA